MSIADRASADAGACVLRHGRFGALRAVTLDVLALYSAPELPCALAVLAHSGAGIATAAIRSWFIDVYLQKLVMHWAAVEEDCCANPAAIVVVDESLLAALRVLGALPRLSVLSVEVPLRASLIRSPPAHNGAAAAAVAGNDGGGAGAGTGSAVAAALFRRLDRLEVRVYATGVPALVGSALGASVVELDLTIMPSDARFMHALTPLRRRLRALRILFVERCVIGAADIAALHCLARAR
jgi:hypothetical protein